MPDRKLESLLRRLLPAAPGAISSIRPGTTWRPTAWPGRKSSLWYHGQLLQLFAECWRVHSIPEFPSPPTERTTVFLNDLRYAFRSWLREPGFALAAILTLALGVGAKCGGLRPRGGRSPSAASLSGRRPAGHSAPSRPANRCHQGVHCDWRLHRSGAAGQDARIAGRLRRRLSDYRRPGRAGARAGVGWRTRTPRDTARRTRAGANHSTGRCASERCAGRARKQRFLAHPAGIRSKRVRPGHPDGAGRNASSGRAAARFCFSTRPASGPADTNESAPPGAGGAEILVDVRDRALETRRAASNRPEPAWHSFPGASNRSFQRATRGRSITWCRCATNWREARSRRCSSGWRRSDSCS